MWVPLNIIPNNTYEVKDTLKSIVGLPDLLWRHLFEPGAGCVGGIQKSSLAVQPCTIGNLCWKFQDPSFKTLGGVAFLTSKSVRKIYLVWIWIHWITLSGDPICFGDSGGPLYKSLGKGKGHVLLGVFSYILWGLCGGPRDLAYYVNVEHNIDWIFQYVPKNSTCMWVKSCTLHSLLT